jgi:hypothetical protein
MGPGKFDKFKIKIKEYFGKNVILCDSCKWNWRSACHDPARPNAKWCKEYEKRGS